MNLDDWRSQIKRGTLDLAILLMVRRQPTYGYQIITQLESYPILSAKENTIYPLLRRLQKEGYIGSTWQDSAEGLPPRKYYSLTPSGQEYLSAMMAQWNELLETMEKIKGDEENG